MATPVLFCSKTKCPIFWPVLLLALFLTLFFGVEYRKFFYDAAVRKVVDAPISVELGKLQETVSRLEGVVDLYFSSASAARPDLRLQEIKKFYEDLKDERAIVRALLLREAMEGRELVHQSDLFQAVDAQIDRLGHLLPREAVPLPTADWEELREEVDALIRQVRAVDAAVARLQHQEAEALLDEIGRQESVQLSLIALLFVSGIALVFSLRRSLRHYRTHAERAQAAERDNALFAAALQTTRVGVLIRDMRKTEKPIVFLNAAFTRLTGYALADTAAHDSSEFLFGWKTDAAAIVAFRRALSLQETATFELLVYRKDGSPFWSEWHLSPVADGDGKLTHFVSLLTDTTAFRQTQEDLIQAKQLAQNASAIKTNFLAMMSHEIRTPINGILGVLKLVEETPLDDEQRHLIGIARTSSHALHGIINDILDFAKIEAGKVEIIAEPFSLAEMMDNIEGLFRAIVNEKGIDLRFDLPSDLPCRFMSDYGRMRQVLLNLLSNAIKFTDKGFVQLRVLSLMNQDVQGMPGVLLRFEVQDTGLGISPEDQGKLFKEFSQIERSFTRRFGGTGLGLAISRRLVELLGGEIGVESQPGKGSKFWFMLPLQIAAPPPESEAPQEQEAVPAPYAADPTRVYHILLVEDNDTNRLVARRYLEKAGFLVEEATNGLEAIEKAKIAAFDLILMDVSMPEMDGMMATCHIRALGEGNARVPIIALTAHAMTGDRELCLAAGMNDYLNKPLDYDSLLKTLGRWLHVRFAAGDAPAAPPPVKKNLAATPALEESVPLYDVPEFDPHVLRRMKEDLGPEVVAQVTRTFLEDSAKRILLFNDPPDRETIRDTAHTLKSCSANCGLVKFGKAMEEIEMAAARGDKERVDRLLPRALDLYASSVRRLEAERGEYTA